MKRIFLLLALGLILAGIAAAWGVQDLRRYSRAPMAERDAERTVAIQRGQGFEGVLDRLEAAGIVRDPLRFRLLARWHGFDRRIKAGEYRLSTAMTPLQLLRNLAEGRVVLIRLTIPEGFTLRQIADAVAEAGLASAEEFLSAASDPQWTRERGIPADSLEGYLFPDTYLFSRSATVPEIIQTPLDRFHAVFREEWRERAAELGFTVHEIVTLASIIERETGAPEERSRIAGVFHNRLRIGMRLQSDPTVIYGVADFDGNLTRAHLDTPTPYNTYQMAGLPPGPIASPGAAALEAALYPMETDELYFVSRGDGTHVFSTNLRDHNRAVRRFQLGQ
ncbi:MAG: endolytic transglycosylase MltG [Desulfococcaceae bacterium]